MKHKILKQIFTALGFLVLAFVAINMNACSKDKGSSNPNQYDQYGYNGQYNYGPNGGRGHLANAIGDSGDMTIRLSISGMNGGEAGATGELIVRGGIGCSVPPGRYGLRTVRPGIYMNGDFYQGFTLRASNGMEIYIQGFLRNQQDPSGARRMSAHANLPGCPTNFF